MSLSLFFLPGIGKNARISAEGRYRLLIISCKNSKNSKNSKGPVTKGSERLRGYAPSDVAHITGV
jgi:hypothetical protein